MVIILNMMMIMIKKKNKNDKNYKIHLIIKKHIKIMRDKRLSELFKAWFSGFVSGDGSLIITPENYSCLKIGLKPAE